MHDHLQGGAQLIHAQRPMHVILDLAGPLSAGARLVFVKSSSNVNLL
jgi:hypothetical protein